MKRLLRGKIIGLLCCLVPVLAFCQEARVETYTDHFLIRVGGSNRSLNLNISPRENGTTRYLQRLWYRPNVKSSIGLGLRFKDLGISFGFNVINDPLVGNKTEQSQYTDFRVNSLGRKIGYDLNYQDYKGYFRSNFNINGFRNLFNSIRSLGRQDSIFTRSDLRLRNYSTNVYYVFNPERFSYRAAFVFDERQLKSGGSFLLTGSLGLLKVNANSSIIPDENELDFHPTTFYKAIDAYTLSVVPGYAHNFIYREKFYFTLGLSGMLGFMVLDGTLEANNERNGSTNYFLKGIARTAVGYHGPSWVAGVSLMGDLQGMTTQHAQFRTSILDFSIFVAHRIETNWMKGKKSVFHFLKKQKED